MINIEQVENLRKHANVSYEEAKEALEAMNGDMLEALILLEKQGKVEPPKNQGRYSTGDLTANEASYSEDRGKTRYNDQNIPPFDEQMSRIWAIICHLVRRGNINHFEVRRYGRIVMSIPVNFLILALLICFWFIIPALILGLFFGCNYKFKGPDLGKESINNVMDNATETAESLKQAIKNEESRNEENKND